MKVLRSGRVKEGEVQDAIRKHTNRNGTVDLRAVNAEYQRATASRKPVARHRRNAGFTQADIERYHVLVDLKLSGELTKRGETELSRLEGAFDRAEVRSEVRFAKPVETLDDLDALIESILKEHDPDYDPEEKQ